MDMFGVARQDGVMFELQWCQLAMATYWARHRFSETGRRQGPRRTWRWARCNSGLPTWTAPLAPWPDSALANEWHRWYM